MSQTFTKSTKANRVGSFYPQRIPAKVVVSHIFLFLPLPGEMIQFDEHIFQMGWNH